MSVFDANGEMVYFAVIDDSITEMEVFYVQPEGMYSYHYHTEGEVRKGSFVHVTDV